MFDRLSQRARILFQQRARAAAMLITGALAALLITGSATAKTTYLIADEGNLITVEGYLGDVSGALARAGVTLSPADRVSSVTSGGVTSTAVTRAMTVTAAWDGGTTAALAYDGTVSDLLETLNVTLGAEDAVSHPLTAPLSDGMTVAVSRRDITLDARATPIPFETQRRENPDLSRGEELAVQTGAYGLMLSTVRTVTEEGGEVLSVTDLGERVSREPTPEVIEYGTRVEPVAPSWLSATEDVLTNISGDDSLGGVLTTASGQSLPYTKAITCVATAYTTERQSWKITATGTTARVGAIAVDPKVIPYGTRMYIVTGDGAITYGVATAEDCGGGVKGKRVDLFYDTYNECINFGVRRCTVYILK